MLYEVITSASPTIHLLQPAMAPVASASSTLRARPRRACGAVLRNFFDPVFRLMWNRFQMDCGVGCRRKSAAYAIERQSHRDASPLTDPAANADGSPMQGHKPLHDGQAKTGPIMTAIVGRASLKKRIANARQIGGGNAEAGITDRDLKRRNNFV